jgi:5,10-methylene-tetrahydrofolate dehydrogenase/methenyl tetrahydrofolate cyclohydrolase
MVPLYLEFGKVASTLESLKVQPNITQLTKSEIIKIVRKRFDINDVDSVDPKLIKISKDKGVMKVGINYERREHLVGNVDIVAIFDKHIEVAAN